LLVMGAEGSMAEDRVGSKSSVRVDPLRTARAARWGKVIGGEDSL
jgi:hypothetical protein